MQDVTKRAVWPSFFILPALLLALLISTVGGLVFWWLGVALMLMLFAVGLPKPFPVNAVSLTVVGFALYLLIHIYLLSPVFTAKGIYFITWFLTGFLVFARLERQQIGLVFKLTVVVFIVLSFWAVFQYVSGQGYLIRAYPRVNTIFYTPNTFAAALNMILLPLICMILYGRGKKTVLVAVVLLFATLLMTQSRGGWLAFTAGMIALSGMGLIFRDCRVDKKRWLVLITLLFCTFALYSGSLVLKKTGTGLDLFGNLDKVTQLENTLRSSTERLKIYDIAWQRTKQRPWIGHGYNHFQYYQLSDQPLSRKGILTKFVHNDYLQIWMETGLVGLLLLFVVIALFYTAVFNYLGARDRKDMILAAGLLSAMTAYFIHALVDFVMYPPVLLLFFGSCLGLTASYISRPLSMRKSDFAHMMHTRSLNPAVPRVMISILCIYLLAEPAVAQLLFEKGLREQKQLDIKSALTSYELARRFAPYEPAYYYTEANLWFSAARATGEREPAQRADRLLVDGASINPFRVESLYLRVLLHRTMPHLLDNPADLETRLSWLEYIMQWQPHDNPTQLEYVNTLYMMGRRSEAMRYLDGYLKDYPKSEIFRKARERYNNLQG